MSDCGICWSTNVPAEQEKQESLSSNLTEEAYQNILRVCEPPRSLPPLDEFVSNDIKKPRVLLSSIQFHEQIYQDGFEGISSQPDQSIFGKRFLAYNPLGLLAGCKKKEGKSETPEEALGRGKNLLGEGKGKEAIKAFEKVLSSDPKNREALGLIITSYIDARELDVAERVARKALANDNNFADAQLSLGLIYFFKGETGASEKEYQKVLAIEPNNIAAHSTLGSLYLIQGKTSAAEKAFKNALKVEPKDVASLNGLGKVYTQMGKLDAAEEELKKALASDPNDPITHRNLGMNYLVKFELDKAEKILRKGLKTNFNQEQLREFQELLSAINRLKNHGDHRE